MYEYNAKDLRNPNRAMLRRVQRKVNLQSEMKDIIKKEKKEKEKDISLNKGLMNKERINILHDVDEDFGLIKNEKTRLHLYGRREFR